MPFKIRIILQPSIYHVKHSTNGCHWRQQCQLSMWSRRLTIPSKRWDRNRLLRRSPALLLPESVRLLGREWRRLARQQARVIIRQSLALLHGFWQSLDNICGFAPIGNDYLAMLFNSSLYRTKVGPQFPDRRFVLGHALNIILSHSRSNQRNRGALGAAAIPTPGHKVIADHRRFVQLRA